MKILKNKQFLEQITELKTAKLKIKNLRGYPSIDQTQRNTVRRELMDGMYEWLYQLLDMGNIAAVYSTEDGIAIEVENEDIINGYQEGNGVVTILLNMSIPNLTYDSMDLLRDNDHTQMEMEANAQN